MSKVSGVRAGGLAVAVAGALFVTACGSSGLSESSTCSDFMKAPAQDQQSIVSKLAGKYQKPDYATPLGGPEVPYYCSTHPQTTLGQFFAAAG